MTVYIEYVIIDNLIIDYLMLKATFALTGITPSRGRLFLSAFFGSAVALLYPLLEVSAVILTLVKIFTGLTIMLFASSYKSVKSYYINVLVFFGYTFITGGAIIGLFSIFNIPYSSEYSVALMAVPVYFVLRALSELVKFVYRRKDVVSLVYSVSLTLRENTKQMQVL